MITTLFTDHGGTVILDIIASRDADITTAMESVVAQQGRGPGGMRLLTANRTNRLLVKAQNSIEFLRQTKDAALASDRFVLTTPELGTVTVIWADGE
jgi:hypothetical protein